MRLRKKDDDKKNIILGIILAVLVIAAAYGAWCGINYYLTEVETAMEGDENGGLSDEMRHELNPEETPEPDDDPDRIIITAAPPSEATGPTILPDTEITPQITPVAESEGKAEFTLATRVGTDLSSYIKAGVAESSASSEYVKTGSNEDNSAAMMFDGIEQTSWKEGVTGYGEGEAVFAKLDAEYKISAITFKLGNWYNYSSWNTTCRPKGLTVWLDGAEYEFSFPDGMTEYCVVFASPVTASEATIRLDSVYIADSTDTCISEVGFYGTAS